MNKKDLRDMLLAAAIGAVTAIVIVVAVVESIT